MAKKNLSKLVKKLITDKTGKRTSVWVRSGAEPKKEKRKSIKDEDLKVGSKFELPNGETIEVTKQFKERGESWVEFNRSGGTGGQQGNNESRAKSLRQFLNNWKAKPTSSESDEVKQISPKKKRTLKEGLSKLSQKLYNKVKRRERGKGGEISLTKGEIKELLAKGRLGFISAGKNPADPRDMKLSDEDIKKRYGKLKDELVELGYVFIPVRGKYGEEEDSYMVMIPEAEKSDLNKLGKKYNQDSVIYAEKGHNELRYTTGENAGKHYDGNGYNELGLDTKDEWTEIDTKEGKMKFRLNINFDELLKALSNFIQILRV